MHRGVGRCGAGSIGGSVDGCGEMGGVRVMGGGLGLSVVVDP